MLTVPDGGTVALAGAGVVGDPYAAEQALVLLTAEIVPDIFEDE